jgi:FAD/FMN-containing dehydrogenase
MPHLIISTPITVPPPPIISKLLIMNTEQPTAPGNATLAANELQHLLNGNILIEGDADYNIARKVWNSMIDRKPGMIVQCLNSNDIIQAVKYAKSNGMEVSVKGGGHNVAGNAVCEKGLMIDLSKMKAIHVDPVKRTATAEPGVLWRELDAATQQYNLATTGGTVSDTGIAGLTLGGGLGWLLGKHGITCDNLLSAEIVTAQGKLLIADKDNNPDLFWAIRGGGGNFGIVTKFEYQLHPFGPNIMAGMILYPMEQGKAVMQFYRDYARQAPDELMAYSGFIVTPDGLPVTFVLPAWTGPMEEAEKHLAPLRSFGSPLADLVAEIPYTQLQSIIDAAAPAGIRRYWKSGYFTDLTDELLDIFIRNVASRPSPLSPVLFFHIRGAATRVDPSATSFVHRQDQWDGDIISQWLDAADDEKNISWARNFWKEIEPLAKGVYVNHLDSDDDPRVVNAYGANFERLKSIKKKYDPDNFFRLNNNILPA